MASPQTEDGFIRIANELLDAILMFPFSKRQLKVVLAVIRKTYGYNKKSDDLSSGQLSALTGLDDAHCRATVRELVAANVLFSTLGRYGSWLSLNKDYQAWAAPGEAKPCQGETPQSAGLKQPASRAETAHLGDGPKQPAGRAKTAHTKYNSKRQCIYTTTTARLYGISWWSSS